jgi:GNAT superfamily N-acetyltransferase
MPASGELDVALFAVRPDARGCGLGRRLLEAVKSRALAMGAHRVSYSTQIENIPARRLVVSNGFLPSHSLFTFHVWLE